MRKLSAFVLACVLVTAVAACSDMGSDPDVTEATLDIIVGPDGQTVNQSGADGTRGVEGPLRIRIFSPDQHTLALEVRGDTYMEAMDRLREKASEAREGILLAMQSGSFITKEDIEAMTPEEIGELRTTLADLRKTVADQRKALGELRDLDFENMTAEERAAVQAQAQERMREIAERRAAEQEIKR